MKVTIKDIASACGVSPITVSRVIAGNSNVSPSTREQVLQAMENAGYKPKGKTVTNVSMRGSGRIIAIMIEDMSDPTKMEIVTCLCEQIAKKNFLPIIIYANTSENWQQCTQMLHDKIAGIIAISALGQSALGVFENFQTDIPLVVIQRCPAWARANSVVTDDYHSAEMAVDRLWELGHRNIALVNMEKGFAGEYETYIGYSDALGKYGVKVNSQYVFHVPQKRESGHMVAAQLHKVTPEVTAVICTNESVGWGIIDTYQNEYHCTVPDDLSVITFDISANESDTSMRKMAAVGSYLTEIADVAVESIINYIEESKTYQEKTTYQCQRLILQPHFFEGSTLGAVKKG